LSPGPRRHAAGRGRPRGRHVRGVAVTPFQPSWPGREPPWPPREPSWRDSLLASARRFITLFYAENRLGPPDRRLWHVRHEIEEWGTYWHTAHELAFGARVAWRNSPQGAGRLDWQSLRVRDRREVTSAPDIAAESVTHLHEATNGGRVRPVVTVFAPDAPGRPGPRILNSQLVGYAGYPTADGVVTGDPENAGLTRLAREAGWPAGRPAGRFDILPLLVREAGGPITVHEIPTDVALEVAITHPEFGWLADLGLRWYAVPVISDAYLDIGGVRYPAAPFNGWHLVPQIGSRDLGERYGQLPVIAARMGLRVAGGRGSWRDRAAAELNLAVAHSFAAAGVTITGQPTPAARVSHPYYEDLDWTPSFGAHPLASLQRAGRCDLQPVASR
jgi:nitric-oxide synthase, bacterial